MKMKSAPAAARTPRDAAVSEPCWRELLHACLGGLSRIDAPLRPGSTD